MSHARFSEGLVKPFWYRMSAVDIPALIEKLCAWTDFDFHGDRQLSDEVLIADGWTVTPDQTFEGGVRWQIGPACCSESTRPHVIHSLDRALAVVPRGHAVSLEIRGGRAKAKVWADGGAERSGFVGESTEATIAVLIAALQAIDAQKTQVAASSAA